MNKHKITSGKLTINILIATAIGLIVNFSYLIFLLVWKTSGQQRGHMKTFPEDSPYFMVAELFFYIITAFVLLTLFTWKTNGNGINRVTFLKRLFAAIIITTCFYFLAPTMNRHGDVMIVAASRRIFNPVVMLKISFMLVVVVLYGKIFQLIMFQQRMTIENERLKTENMRSRYDVLINQMNPHFFFNSLNSLSSLVREDKNTDALNYIDRLSDTFRYIMQGGGNTITTLREELQFIESYKYLLEIRYEGKLFIDINVPPNDMDRKLPALTLQPLIENAVKHNTITRSNPLNVTISSDGINVFVSNPLQPKIDDSERGTGIGLKNIASRYRLLTECDITIINDSKSFTVRLPLVPDSKII